MSWLGTSFIFTALRISQTSMPCWLADLMMQFWTYFWRFRQCHLNFMPFASALHAAVAFSRATLSALDSFAAAAGVGTNAMPLTSTVAIMPAMKAVAKWYMIPSLELSPTLLDPPIIGRWCAKSNAIASRLQAWRADTGHGHVRPRAARDSDSPIWVPYNELRCTKRYFPA